MTDQHPLVLLPNGQPASMRKAALPEGRGLIAGTTPLSLGTGSMTTRRSHRKLGDWGMYYGMYTQHPVVFAAINKLATTAANTGWDYVPRNTQEDPRVREVIKLENFFDQQPNFNTVLFGVYQDLMIFGDCFVYVVPDRMRRPTLLKKLPCWTISIVADANGAIKGYKQKHPGGREDQGVFFEPHEIVHIKNPDPNNDLYGLSPLEALKETVATDLQAMRFNRKFFENSANTGTVFSVQDASEEEMQRNREWLTQDYTGTDMAHRPLVVSGNVKVHKSVATHQEMGFLQGLEYTQQVILAVLNVPPSKLSFMENANRSNSREQDKSFRAESVAPLQHVFESALNDQFVQEVLGVKHTVWKHSDADIRDAQELADVWGKHIEKGVLNINEVRAMMGRKPVDGGQTNFIMTPTGAVPLDRLDLYFQLPQTNVDNVPPTADDPPEGEPAPAPSPNPTGVTRSSGTLDLALRGVLKSMQKADDDEHLRQAWAYAMDAVEEVDHPVIHGLAQSLSKAVKATDPTLRMAYVERASGYMSQLTVRTEVVDG